MCGVLHTLEVVNSLQMGGIASLHACCIRLGQPRMGECKGALGGRAQGDSTLRHVKDLDVVLGAETAVLILDDTSGVWPLHQRNLLQVP